MHHCERLLFLSFSSSPPQESLSISFSVKRNTLKVFHNPLLASMSNSLVIFQLAFEWLPQMAEAGPSTSLLTAGHMTQEMGKLATNLFNTLHQVCLEQSTLLEAWQSNPAKSAMHTRAILWACSQRSCSHTVKLKWIYALEVDK